MDSSIDTRMKKAIHGVDRPKSPECLDAHTIGLYAENKLSEEERRRTEEHLNGCLYCVKQLNEMKELLYYDQNPADLSPVLAERLSALCLTKKGGQGSHAFARSLFKYLKAFFVFPATQWRYSTVSLVSACAAVLVTLFLIRPGAPVVLAPYVDANSFVNVKALSDEGKVLSEAQGVVLDSKGLVASNLYQLAGARTIQITLRDGRTFRTKHAWMDEDKNIAVMKVDDNALPAMPRADIARISVGERVFIIPGHGGTKKGFNQSLISDFKQMPGRRRSNSIQYIQIATLTTNTTRGAIVDDQGRLVGLVITEEKNINLAVPIADAERLVKESKAMPLSEVKAGRRPAQALNYYLKGILARDIQRWDQAIEFYKKALELNPNLNGAHLELGYVYYRKRLYDLEAREYEAVLETNPDNTDALTSLATNLETKGLYAEAIQKYEHALALDPEDAETMSELGLAYLAVGRKDKTADVSVRLRKLDPGYGELLYRLSR